MYHKSSSEKQNINAISRTFNYSIRYCIGLQHPWCISYNFLMEWFYIYATIHQKELFPKTTDPTYQFGIFRELNIDELWEQKRRRINILLLNVICPTAYVLVSLLLRRWTLFIEIIVLDHPISTNFPEKPSPSKHLRRLRTACTTCS